MENKFYTDNFEQLLKENADKFRMYPSKRVWHGIYNDLHPSRRWPSFAIWLLLISSMVFIGLSNKSNVAHNNGSKNIASVVNNNKASNTDLIAQNSNTAPDTKTENDKLNNNQLGSVNTSAGSADKKTFESINKLNSKEANQNLTSINKRDKKLSTTAKNTPTVEFNTLLNNYDRIDENTNSEIATVINTEGVSESQKMIVSITGSGDNINTEKKVAEADAIAKNTEAETEKKKAVVTNINNDKAWVEDYAFHNRPSPSKWKTRVSYEVYFTPSVGYRTLAKNTLISPSASLVATNGNLEDFKKALSQGAAINMELGGNFLYSISKNWNLKAGVQLNYTNYRINAFELKHPTMTTLALNDASSGFPILSPRSTTLANTSGLSSKKLNNNTYQLSIPLGADIKIAGKNNLKWYAGATIQPTLILGGNSYLISSDLKNYVSDNSFMRKMNLNAGVESFVSYKTKSGITINAGPQFRYQLFSTYNSQYTYNEKMYNLGLKIGIITKF